jgi:hypothetical protein
MLRQSCIVFIALLSVSLGCPLASARSPREETARLQALLDQDRFLTYAQLWSDKKKREGLDALSERAKDLQRSELAKVDPERLKDARSYDNILAELIPDARTKKSDYIWDYPFLKNKLSASYRVDLASEKLESITENFEVIEETMSESIRAPPKRRAQSVALDADNYISQRMTRGLFWEASETGRAIELHVGTATQFRESVLERRGEILGQIRTYSRNYNPIYLVRFDDGSFRYAITEIGGEDRLEHIIEQSRFLRDGGKSPKFGVFGSAQNNLLAKAQSMAIDFAGLPTPDHTVIGQKGALERALQALAKAQSLDEVKSKRTLRSTLSQSELRMLDQGFTPEQAIEKPLIIETIFEKAQETLGKDTLPTPSSTLFDLDYGTHTVSDVLLGGASGRSVRWRLISNVWGDEILPIAEGIRTSGCKKVTFIGTAGALPGSQLEVGDVFLPDRGDLPGVGQFKFNAQNRSSALQNAKGRAGGTITQIASPLQETHAWLKETSSYASAVDVESAYLAQAFKDSEIDLRPILLISDVVGAEGHDLSRADSSARKTAQIAALRSLFEEDRVSSVSTKKTLDSTLDQLRALEPKRDLASLYQVLRKGDGRSVRELKNLLKTEEIFTTEYLEKNLLRAGEALTALLGSLDSHELRARAYVSAEFKAGSWNPKSSPLKIALRVDSADQAAELTRLMERLKESDPALKRALEVKMIRGPPGPEYHPEKINLTRRRALIEAYAESARELGGIAAQETRSGKLKFVLIPGFTLPREHPSLAFFAPSTETRALLEQITQSAKSGKAFEQEVARLSKDSCQNCTISIEKVSSLKEGRLAEIVPQWKGRELQITVRLTDEARSNPAVLLEELIHLYQITDAPAPWLSANRTLETFVTPYHWAEVVRNAELGSKVAEAQLARAEVEASRALQDASEFHRAFNLKAIKPYADSRVADAIEQHSRKLSDARIELKKRATNEARMREAWTKLETQRLKLNDLVAANDRKGVRALVESFLPWDVMEPVETEAWRGWLEAIERPSVKNSKIIFRGMYDDLVMKNAQEQVYLMSTVLTKNQGSYTRRLRSLSTLREKFAQGALRAKGTPYQAKGVASSSISAMMTNHGVEARGSPFLSFANYDVATQFGPRRLGAFQIDERRLVPNFVTPGKYMYQQEHLVPLIIFPDEVVHYHDYWLNPVDGVGERDPVNRKKHFIKIIEEKIGRRLSTEEISGRKSVEGFIASGQEFFRDLFRESNRTSLRAPVGPDWKCVEAALRALKK